MGLGAGQLSCHTLCLQSFVGLSFGFWNLSGTTEIQKRRCLVLLGFHTGTSFYTGTLLFCKRLKSVLLPRSSNPLIIAGREAEINLDDAYSPRLLYSGVCTYGLESWVLVWVGATNLAILVSWLLTSYIKELPVYLALCMKIFLERTVKEIWICSAVTQKSGHLGLCPLQQLVAKTWRKLPDLRGIALFSHWSRYPGTVTGESDFVHQPHFDTSDIVSCPLLLVPRPSPPGCWTCHIPWCWYSWREQRLPELFIPLQNWK